MFLNQFGKIWMLCIHGITFHHPRFWNYKLCPCFDRRVVGRSCRI